MIKVLITFRNIHPQEWFKEYVNTRLMKFKKFTTKTIETHIIVTVEKFRNIVEINLISQGINLNGKKESKDIQIAFDNVIEKIERQFIRHKERYRKNKESILKEMSLSSEKINTTISSDRENNLKELINSAIVETKHIILKPMSIDDAILQIQEKKSKFVLYRDLFTEKIMLVYQRDNGSYLLLETV